MRKIPTLYQRTEDRRGVIDAVTPGCEWVLNGEGVATRKWDGTCVLVSHDGTIWTRREVKPNVTPPPDFVAVDFDEVTGKSFGWEPYANSGFARYVDEALEGDHLDPGTYELCGPKINGNPEGVDHHVLLRHGGFPLLVVPLTFDGLRSYLADHAQMEGIVWHRPNGRMAKIKARDFR